MRTYLARVLVEHCFSPEREGYSSFSELVLLGQARLKRDYSTVLFDGDKQTLDVLLAEFADQLDDTYLTADGYQLTQRVREIVKLEDVLDEVVISQELIELDEQFYTFDEKVCFEDFRKRYLFGRWGG